MKADDYSISWEIVNWPDVHRESNRHCSKLTKIVWVQQLTKIVQQRCSLSPFCINIYFSDLDRKHFGYLHEKGVLDLHYVVGKNKQFCLKINIFQENFDCKLFWELLQQHIILPQHHLLWCLLSHNIVCIFRDTLAINKGYMCYGKPRFWIQRKKYCGIIICSSSWHYIEQKMSYCLILYF